MKTATRFQFWSVSHLAKTVLVTIAGVLLLVVTASLVERPSPEPKSSQGIGRKQGPLPTHHRVDTFA